MKKILFSLTLFVLMLQSFSQDTTRAELTKADYLQKSKRQKTAAWVLLGGGLGLMAVGVGTYKVEIDLGPLFGQPASTTHVDNTGSTLAIVAGLGAMVGSIPVFISAHHSKKKAAALAIGNQRFLFPQQRGLTLTAQPTLRLTIPL